MGQSPEQKRLYEERLLETKKGIEAGEKMKSIAKRIGVTEGMVKKYKKYLEEEDMLEILTKEEKLNIIKQMVKDKKTLVQIAKRLKTTRQAVSRYRDELIEQGELTGSEKSVKPHTIKMKRRINELEKILEENSKNEDEKTREQLGEELGVSNITVSRDKVRLREQKEQEFAEWSKEIIKRYEKFYGQSASIKRFEEYLILCKERYEQRLIEEEHLLPIKYASIATETYSNIAFYIKLCIRFNQFEEAMKFAKSYVSCETFSQEERGKIKKSLTECEKFCQAIRMINSPTISDEAIREVTGLSQVVRKHEENDDGDEPEIA